MLITTNTPSTLQVEEPSSISQAFEAGEWSREDATIRVCLRDEHGFGVQVPATLSDNFDTATFLLPEQLNVFDPELPYFLSLEVVLPGLLLIPANLSVKVSSTSSQIAPGNSNELPVPPGGSAVTANSLDDLDPVPISEGANKAYNAIGEPADLEEEFPGLDEALAVVAPMVIPEEPKRTVKLEEISAEVIEEALWKRKEAQPTSSVSAPPSPVGSPGLRKALKNLLRM